jgi:hypothetical protein
MSPLRGTDDSGYSAGREGDFDELLISGNFSEENCREYPLTICVGWLGLRERQISMWERDFRLHRSELLTTLVDIRDSLAVLYQKMDRLCGGGDCYLALALSTVPTVVQGYYDEFLTAYDATSGVLQYYVAYANHYKHKYEEGEIPAPEPGGMQKGLFDGFAYLRKSLRNLAEKLADPALSPTAPGRNTPDGPGRRTA